MDLWIRTQSKEQLLLAQEVKLQINTYDGECQILVANKHTYHYAGKYKTKERALEILDEIQSKIGNLYLCKIKPMVKIGDARRAKEYLEENYIGDFIMTDATMDIEPINKDVIVYELPKE